MGRGRRRLWLDFLLQPDFLAIVVFFCFTLLLYNIKLLRTQLYRQNRGKKYTAKAMRTTRLVGTSKRTWQPLSIYTAFWQREAAGPIDLMWFILRQTCASGRTVSQTQERRIPEKERTRFFSSQEAQQLCYSMTTCTSSSQRVLPTGLSSRDGLWGGVTSF